MNMTEQFDVYAAAVEGASSGMSAQGVITLSLIGGGVVWLKVRENRKKNGGAPKKRNKLRKENAPADVSLEPVPDAMQAAPPPPSRPPTPVVGTPQVTPPPPPSRPPTPVVGTPPPSPPPAPAVREAVNTLGPGVRVPTPEEWGRMCRERGLVGLQLTGAQSSPFGTDILVRFEKSMNFSHVQTNLKHVATGLDLPMDWKLQLKPGASHGEGIIRVVSQDPLKESIDWAPSSSPVKLADPCWISRTAYGDDVHVSLKQRIGVFGGSGSGKSCVQRVLGAHVVQAVDADLEVWDLKMGLESQHYEGKAKRLTSVKEAVQRVDWLVNQELPRRAQIMLKQKTSEWEETPDNKALVIMIDEGNRVVHGFSQTDLKLMFQAFEQARAFGVYFIWSTQFPKSDNLPTEIRSQLNCRISLMLENAEESRVVYKEGVKEGWSPHNLIGSGWMLIRDRAHREPEDSKARWLSKDAFELVCPPETDEGQLSEIAEDSKDRQPRTGGQPAEVVSDMGQETVSDAVWAVLALSDSPLGVSELSRLTGRSKAAVHGALSRMETDCVVCRTGTETRPTYCLRLSE